MASGKAHTRATLIATPFVFVALGPVAACGTLSGIPLTPDLDHHATTGVEKLPIIGSLWQALWTPYERWLPHRARLSHWPIVGTIIRVAYLALMLLLMWATSYALDQTFLGWDIIPEPQAVNFDWQLFGSWFAGLCVSDFFHWTMDIPKGTK